MKQYMTNRKDSNGNIPGGQVKYFNEYYYGNGLVALNTMKATPHFFVFAALSNILSGTVNSL